MTLNDNLVYAACAAMAMLLFVLVKFQLTILSLVISVIIAVVTIVNIRVGLLFWFVAAPLSPLISAIHESIPILFNPALIAGALINIGIKGKIPRPDRTSILVFGYLLLSTITATFIYRHNGSFNIVIFFISIILISYLIISCYIKFPDFNKGITISLFFSAVVAMLIALESLGSRRLAVDGSVRQLSNVLSFSSTFIILNLLFAKKYFTGFWKFALISGVSILVIGLLLTVSRGSILALFASVAIATLVYLYKTGNLRFIFLGAIYVIAIISVSYVVFHDYVIDNFGIYIEVITQRFGEDGLSSGSAIRQFIWKEVLGAFHWIELTFGLGIDGFRAKANSVGIEFYAHSVFIDILATSGALVLLVIILFLISTGLKSVKVGNVIAIGLIAFVILNFISHGSITAPLFWAGIGLARGSLVKNLQIVRNMPLAMHEGVKDIK